MNDQSSTPNDPLEPSKQALSSDALARRRLLLRGASTGAAAVAALQPMGALATSQSTVLTCLNASSKDVLCTLSGVQSAAHSFGPNIVKIASVCKSPTYWKNNTGSWPSGLSSTCNTGTLVDTLLPGCYYGYNGMTVLYMLQTYPTSKEAYFICAYLNGTAYYSATSPTTTMCFPYPSSKVLEFWNAGGTTRTNACNLFKGISTLTT